MNRLLFVWTACLLLAVLSAHPLSAAPTFTITSEDLLGPNWNMIASGTTADGTPFSVDAGTLTPPIYSGEFQTSSAYGAPLPAGFLGLVASGVGRPGTRDYASFALSGVDLGDGDYDSFDIVLSNDDDDPWQYRLLADDGDETVLGPWTSIGPDGDRQSLSLDISGLEGTGLVGFQIGSDVREDSLRTSVLVTQEVPRIPAPGALLLGAIGGFVVHRLRTRRYV